MMPARAGEHRIDELEAIAEQERDAVALAKAALRQVAGDCLHSRVEDAIRNALVAEHQCITLGRTRGGIAQDRVDRHRPLRETADHAIAIVCFVAQRGHVGRDMFLARMHGSSRGLV